MDEFTKIVSSAFGPFIGHHRGLLACIKSDLKEFFIKNLFLFFFITLQNYVNMLK